MGIIDENVTCTSNASLAPVTYDCIIECLRKIEDINKEYPPVDPNHCKLCGIGLSELTMKPFYYDPMPKSSPLGGFSWLCNLCWQCDKEIKSWMKEQK